MYINYKLYRNYSENMFPNGLCFVLMAGLFSLGDGKSQYPNICSLHFTYAVWLSYTMKSFIT